MSKRNLKPSGEGWVQLIAGIGFIVLLIVINIVDPTFYPTMWHLATSGSMEEVADYIQSFGPMAMLVSRLFTVNFHIYSKRFSIWHVARNHYFLAC